VQTENEKAVRDPIAEAIDLLEKSAEPFDKACMLLRAALQSQVSNTDGWVMVPVEPTNAMVEAAELDACGRLLADDIADAYSAMLSAAPKAPQKVSNTTQEADDDATFTLDDAIAHAKGLEHQVKMLTRQRDSLELIARMVAGALEKAGFKADEVDNPADAIELLHSRLKAATASQESARGQEAVEPYATFVRIGRYGGGFRLVFHKEEPAENVDLFVAPPTSTAIAAIAIKQAAGIVSAFAKECYSVNATMSDLEVVAQDILALTPAGAEAELEALMMKVAEAVDCDPLSDRLTIVRRVLDEMKGE
jgi:hypothetical protein